MDSVCSTWIVHSNLASVSQLIWVNGIQIGADAFCPLRIHDPSGARVAAICNKRARNLLLHLILVSYFLAFSWFDLYGRISFTKVGFELFLLFIWFSLTRSDFSTFFLLICYLWLSIILATSLIIADLWWSIETKCSCCNGFYTGQREYCAHTLPYSFIEADKIGVWVLVARAQSTCLVVIGRARAIAQCACPLSQCFWQLNCVKQRPA